MSLNENIRLYRKRLNLTQEQLAKKANVSLITVRRYEKGSTNPTMETLEKIAEALEVTSADLLDLSPAVDFSKLLKECRLKKGLNYEECAKLLECDVEWVKAAESGEYPLNRLTMIALKDLLDIPMAQVYASKKEDVPYFESLLKYTNSEYTLSELELSLLVNFDSLNEKGQQKAVENIEDLTKIAEYRKKDADSE